jgi:hypothetical protein
MSLSTFARTLPRRFRLVQQSFLQHDGLAFADVLPEEDIQAAFDEQGVNFAQDDDGVYTPQITLWAFLSQTLFNDKQRACAAAVARVVVLMVALGRSVSSNTSAYCRARGKLPAAVVERLAIGLADGCERSLPPEWLWCGRHVHLVDGTTLSMPDTAKNQQAWPQPATQAEGLGFPVVRLVVMMSLATAMLTGMKLGPYQGKETGETALFRQLLGQLPQGDIFVADRYHCSYFMIALAQQSGVDCVVRLHHRRTADFRRGRRLGKGDHVVCWRRPQRPQWMDEETYQQMPESIEVREVHVRVNQPGFRTESLVVVSTLTDAQTYTRHDLAELYHKRWLVELDIRTIKVALGMDILRCKSPHMIHTEIWTCLLSYNLIRKTILEAAYQSGHSPRQISFTAAMQQLAASWTANLLMDESQRALLIEVSLHNLAHCRVGHRPGRVEPRAVKRRPKPHKLLTKPRKEARQDQDFIAGKSPA